MKIDEDGDEQKDDWCCEFCKDIFTEKKALRLHILTHMSRPYLCTVCGKSFLARHTLATHSRIHTGNDKNQLNFNTSNKITVILLQMKDHIHAKCVIKLSDL